MGRVSEAQSRQPDAWEQRLPWGPVVRGLRWEGGSDRVLLLHEPGADIDAWGALPATLAQRLPLDVTEVDLPGHGLSDDPWQEERFRDLLWEMIRGVSHPGRNFVLAAGTTALAALSFAAELDLAGLVSFSPTTPPQGEELARSPRVPKLLFAGALSGDDLRVARELAAACGGWAAVTSVPVAERGTALLASAWQGQLIEQTVAFLRDCLGQRPTLTPAPCLPDSLGERASTRGPGARLRDEHCPVVRPGGAPCRAEDDWCRDGCGRSKPCCRGCV
jgi:pimeloyl-ACP methyl ester carboxylesterase